MRSSTWLCASGVLCSAVAIAVYWNTVNCGIVYDDEPAIKKNKDLRPEAAWTDLLYHDFWGAEMASKTSHKSYRPLCVATFRLNYLLHELQPMGYHLVNVLLHGAVCYLYVQLCGVVFSQVWPALIAGLLYAVHPIHTEAVAGLVGRTELLSGVFYTSSFLFYCRSAKTQSVMWMVPVVACCLCAVLSKEQGITIVGVCVVYDFFLVQRGTLVSGLKMLVTAGRDHRRLPLWFKGFVSRVGILAAFSVTFLFLRVWLMQGGPDIFNRSINPPLYMDTPYRQLSWIYLTFVNAWLLLSPAHLCPDWRFGLAPLINSVMDPHNLLSLVTLVGVAILVVYGLKHSSERSRILLVCLALMIIPFLPASNLFFPVGFVVAERVLYLPSMGFCMLVAYGAMIIQSTAQKFVSKAIVKLSLLSLILAMAGRTFQQNREWESNLTLYSAGVRCNPDNGVMLTNLGIEHGRLRNFSFAESLYRRSILVAPDHSRGYSNLGGLLEALKRYSEAEEAFRKAVEVGVADSTGEKVIDTYMFLIDNVILRNKSRLPDALQLVDEALSTYPTYGRLYVKKGVLLAQLNRAKEAVHYLDIALRSNLRSVELFYHLGLAYEQLQEGTKAEDMFKRALAFDKTHADALYHLGKMMYYSTAASDQDRIKKLREAERYLQSAISAKPRHFDSHHTLGMVYFDLGNYMKAKEMYEYVLKFSPNESETIYQLARTLAYLNDHRTAAAKLKALLKFDRENAEARKLLKSLEKHM